MARLLLHPLGSSIQVAATSEARHQNRTRHDELERALAEQTAAARSGWGAEYQGRIHRRGRLTARERVGALVDDPDGILELGTLVGAGREYHGRTAPGAGAVTALARVEGRWCVVIANDNTVASGAWWPGTPEKITRAQQVALRLRLPVVYLVDCSGLFLPEQANTFPGATGAGRIFHLNADLAAAGVPQVAGVFGSCIAGGGYLPIISDRVVMTESAYLVIAGAALVKGAKSARLTSLDIGGPEVHVHQSGCADERAPDDQTAIRLLQEEVARLPSPATAFYRHGATPAPPRFPPGEIAELLPADPREVYEIDEVIARLVDGSLFHEVLPEVGREVVTGVGRISGLWTGLIANRQGLVEEPERDSRLGGVLYREGIAKLSAFARACDEDGLPLVWLQDVSGFDIGAQAEREGLLGFGSSLIYSNSTHRNPTFTVLLRKASGAGYYAMAGLPYDPVVQLSTPVARQAVMEGRTLALATYGSRLDDDLDQVTDPAERAAVEQGMARVSARIESEMDPVAAAVRHDTDEVVPAGRLRVWLECLIECAWQSTGYRRIRNPRIWSLHDLEALWRRW